MTITNATARIPFPRRWLHTVKGWFSSEFRELTPVEVRQRDVILHLEAETRRLTSELQLKEIELVARDKALKEATLLYERSMARIKAETAIFGHFFDHDKRQGP